MARKPTKKMTETRVGKLYPKYCHGIVIPIMQVGEVMEVGVKACEEGDDDETVGQKLKTYALGIAV